MIKEFKNEYGIAIISSVSDEMSIKDVLGKNIDDSLKFDIDTAEKLTLITGGGYAHCCYQMDIKKFYLILYTSKSTCYICKIDRLEYAHNANPAKELDRLNSNQPLSIY